MIVEVVEIFIEVEKDSADKRVYDEKTLEFQGIRQGKAPYPFAYGFIMNTETEDGDGVDAYVITKDPLPAGQAVMCEVLGMLEVFEGDEVDHKVIASPIEEKGVLEDEAIETIKNFIHELWKNVPDVEVRVGTLFSAGKALQFVKQNTVE